MSVPLFRDRLRVRPGFAWTMLFTVLLTFEISLLWLFPLGRSFWVDETVTAFVVHHGAADPSLAIAPQVPKSDYYAVARIADGMFGLSEVGYRIPSILAAAFALFFIARLAARLIDPQAAWFAVFACLTLAGFNIEAADARPYALGFCVVAASFLFLVRWLDSAKWIDAIGFVVCATLIWRVHLIFWPIYPVFVGYAVVRLARGETRVTWTRAVLVFACLGAALLPTLAGAIAINRGAHDHVIAAEPRLRVFADSLKWRLPLFCAAGAWLLSRFLRVTREPVSFPWATMCLLTGWWLIPAVFLYSFSWLSQNSVFVPRYLSILLPGVALATTFLVGLILPEAYWKYATALMAVGVLFTMPRELRRSNSDWRGAERRVKQLDLPPSTPVIFPSPFVEARWPVWRPDYPLSGFLYAHLAVYPVPGTAFPFPFKSSPEAETYAGELSMDVLAPAGRFVIYGGDLNVHYWRDFFAERPELAGWSYRSLGSFGDVDVVLFENIALARVSLRVK